MLGPNLWSFTKNILNNSFGSVMSFNHFLMMAFALFIGPGLEKSCQRFENLLSSSLLIAYEDSPILK